MNINDITLTMSGAAYSHLFIGQVVVGGQEELNNTKDAIYPVVAIDFPIQGTINGAVKEYQMAFEVHDRLIADDSYIGTKLMYAGKVETMAEDVFHLIKDALNDDEVQVIEPNEISFLIDLPAVKDDNVFARVEFVVRLVRRFKCPIPTK